MVQRTLKRKHLYRAVRRITQSGTINVGLCPSFDETTEAFADCGVLIVGADGTALKVPPDFARGLADDMARRAGLDPVLPMFAADLRARAAEAEEMTRRRPTLEEAKAMRDVWLQQAAPATFH